MRGRLTQRFAASFEGMRIEPGADTTALTGALRDQSHLMGILEAIDALGIELISVAPDSSLAASRPDERLVFESSLDQIDPASGALSTVADALARETKVLP